MNHLCSGRCFPFEIGIGHFRNTLVLVLAFLVLFQINNEWTLLRFFQLFKHSIDNNGIVPSHFMVLFHKFFQVIFYFNHFLFQKFVIFLNVTFYLPNTAIFSFPFFIAENNQLQFQLLCFTIQSPISLIKIINFLIGPFQDPKNVVDVISCRGQNVTRLNSI